MVPTSSDVDRTLRLAYSDLFLLAGRMRDGELSVGRTAELRAYARRALDEQRRDLLRAGLEDEVIADAQLALIALLDESAHASPNQDFAEEWMRDTLQYGQYRHNNLGKVFFERLDYLRQRPDASLALLEIFARCLAWGFGGRYRDDGRLDDLERLRDTLFQDLRRAVGPPPLLSAPFDSIIALPAPPWLLGSPALAALACGLILCVGLFLSALLYWHARETNEALRAFVGGASGERSTELQHTPRSEGGH